MLFAEAVQVAIQDLGLSVTRVVTTGEDAIAEADRDLPDVIFMDIGLPDQSGLVAGQKILDRHPEAKIIALTALSDRASVDEALRLVRIDRDMQRVNVLRVERACVLQRVRRRVVHTTHEHNHLVIDRRAR